LKAKGDLKVKVMILLTKLKIAAINVMVIRYDGIPVRIRLYLKNADINVLASSLNSLVLKSIRSSVEP
jgi:hypothetical protein